MKRTAPACAVILLLAACFGLGGFIGKNTTKPKDPPAQVVQQEQDRGAILYSDMIAPDSGPTIQREVASLAPAPAPVPKVTTQNIPDGGLISLAPVMSQQQEQEAESPAPLPDAQTQDSDNGRCVSVYDGDTITVKLDKSPQKLTKVRLIGVDAPELVAGEFGDKVAGLTRLMLLGQKVKLVYDKERYDKYGRTLAYVYMEDGTFVNARLVEKGYARILTIPPNNAHTEEFEALKDKAQKERCGIWADPPPECSFRVERVVVEWIF